MCVAKHGKILNRQKHCVKHTRPQFLSEPKPLRPFLCAPFRAPPASPAPLGVVRGSLPTSPYPIPSPASRFCWWRDGASCGCYADVVFVSSNWDGFALPVSLVTVPTIQASHRRYGLSPLPTITLLDGVDHKRRFGLILQRLSGYAPSELEVSGSWIWYDDDISVSPLDQD